jgi:hypothetical protein
MRNYIVSIKNLYGEFETLYNGDNRGEAKRVYRSVLGQKKGEENYLQCFLHTMHESRRFSGKGVRVREKVEPVKKKRGKPKKSEG